MDQQEDIQDRPGFELDMEHSAAMDYVRVNEVIVLSSFSQCKLPSHTPLHIFNMDTCHTIYKE